MLAGHESEYLRVVWIVASLFGVAALGVVWIIYRRAVRRHELELAERIIAEHDQSGAVVGSSGSEGNAPNCTR